MTDKLPTYGGQAVIEGVMMRGAKTVAVAMRDPDNEIVIHQEDLGGLYRSRVAKIPFLRGLVILWDALGLGMRALTISANLQTGEDENIEGVAMYLTIAISLTIGIGLFILTPAAVSSLVERSLDWRPSIGTLLEGLVRLLLLVGYIKVIGLMPDIKRVFGYHGAEHKTINAFEAGADLTPDKVAEFSLEHPRCGTAFLLSVVVISVLIFSILGPLPLLTRLLGRLLLLPLVASLAYEYIRWTANHMHWPVVRLIVVPNLALQRLTTREPSLDMLEVSIAAFNSMRSSEMRTESAPIVT
jgi:uncharacterized protein YqhQ